MKQTTNMARVIGQIQAMARKINEYYFNNELDLDRCVWTVSSQPTSYGFFTPYNSYTIFDKITGEREAVQISLGAETINRPIENVVATMIHEMTHYYNFMKGVKDTSRGNRYHNKFFKREAEKHGIKIDYDNTIGYSITSPTEDLIDWIIREGFEELRLQEKSGSMLLIGGFGTSRKSNSIKLVCPLCKQIARTTNPDHKIGCFNCMIEMIEA